MSTVFEVKNIHCQACVKRINVAIERAVPGARVTIDVGLGRVEVALAGGGVASAADQTTIIAAIAAAGYPAEVAA